MDRGIKIDSKDEQPENAFASIPVKCEPDSNVKEESLSHNVKESAPRNSTEAGRQIDFNDEQTESAFDSIRVSFDPDSNINDEIDLQPAKE
jgi:hypothetical protein